MINIQRFPFCVVIKNEVGWNFNVITQYENADIGNKIKTEVKNVITISKINDVKVNAIREKINGDNAFADLDSIITKEIGGTAIDIGTYLIRRKS
jgi:hypothetical protein